MASVNPQNKRGSAELAVLPLLGEPPMHGYEIAKQIEAQTGGVLRFDMASLYPMLHRWGRKSWGKAEWQTLPNGRRRRCYRLTASGRKHLPMPFGLTLPIYRMTIYINLHRSS